jgi:hypothetical protein
MVYMWKYVLIPPYREPTYMPFQISEVGLRYTQKDRNAELRDPTIAAAVALRTVLIIHTGALR